MVGDHSQLPEGYLAVINLLGDALDKFEFCNILSEDESSFMNDLICCLNCLNEVTIYANYEYPATIKIDEMIREKLLHSQLIKILHYSNDMKLTQETWKLIGTLCSGAYSFNHVE